MTTSRLGFHHRALAAGLTLLMASTFTACVSVKESGTKVSAPPAPTSSVAFRSVPEDAEVFVDGQFRGTTPVTLHLAAGTHKVELRLEGFLVWERELTVVAGNDTRVAATLQQE
jgi:hypothetical protein